MVIRVNGHLISEPSALRFSTVVVAAYNSKDTTRADFVCPATDALGFITDTVLPTFTSTGGTLVFLDGTYSMDTASTPIDLDSLSTAYIFRMVGMGATSGGASTIIRANASGSLVNINGHGVDIQNMYFYNPNYATQSSTAIGVNTWGWSGGTLSSCYFNGLHGIVSTGAIGPSGVNICENYFSSTDRAINNSDIDVSAAGANELYISGNIFGPATGQQNPSWGINLGTSTTEGNIIQGNHFLTHSYPLIAVSGDSSNGGLRVIGNEFNLQGLAGNGDFGIYQSGGIFANNEVWCGVYNSGAGRYHHGINANSGGATQHTFVVGNRFLSNDYASPRASAVRILGSNVTVENNLFVGGLSTCLAGVNVTTGSNNYVKNNRFTMGTVAFASNDIVNAGTNTEYYVMSTDIFSDIVDDADTDYIVDAQDLSGGAPIVCTIAHQPDVPRNVVLTFTHPTLTAYNITVAGVDMNGRAVTETFTEADGWTVTGNRAYQSITSITLNTDTGHAAGDLLDVGPGAKFGLGGQMIAIGDVVLVKKNGITISGGGVDYTVNTTYNTVALTTVGDVDDLAVLFRKCANTLEWT